jgi:hypothetical protein
MGVSPRATVRRQKQHRLRQQLIVISFVDAFPIEEISASLKFYRKNTDK